ncbi:MAG: hypothetical protein H6742_13185 [Alphaproteobacteria bacterium]|nr:hypothetical protein [Alphaproteobacteria bacterium]
MAFVARRLLVSRRPDPFGPSFWAANLFGVTYALGVGWAAWQAPDWMLNYFIPVERLPVPLFVVHLLFVLCCSMGASAGHVLTAVCLQRGWTARAVGVFLTGITSLLGLWFITLDSYLHVGTYQEYWAGAATLLPESHIAMGFNLLGIVFGFVFVVPAVLLFRAGRRLRVA